MHEHFTPEELKEFVRGNAGRDRSRAIVRHLLSRCEQCRIAISRLAPPFLFGEPHEVLAAGLSGFKALEEPQGRAESLERLERREQRREKEEVASISLPLAAPASSRKARTATKATPVTPATPATPEKSAGAPPRQVAAGGVHRFVALADLFRLEPAGPARLTSSPGEPAEYLAAAEHPAPASPEGRTAQRRQDLRAQPRPAQQAQKAHRAAPSRKARQASAAAGSPPPAPSQVALASTAHPQSLVRASFVAARVAAKIGEAFPIGQQGFELLREMKGEPLPGCTYERAMENAVSEARRHLHHLRREKAKMADALARLQADGIEGFRQFPARLRGLAGFEALLRRSWELRFEDPKQMADLALLATVVAGSLSVERYGVAQVRAFECRATIELANAYRVAGRLDDAQHTIERASQLYYESMQGRLLAAHLFEVQGSIHGDRREFQRSFVALDTAFRLYRREQSRHFAGRALIIKALYLIYADEPAQAVSLQLQGLTLIDPERDPHLGLVAVHNVALLLVDSSRLREARRILWEYRHLYESPHAGRREKLRFRWLLARIDAGNGEHERAERAFIELRQGFEEVRQPYDAAVVSLDLASLWLRQGDRSPYDPAAAEAKRSGRQLVLEAAQGFLELQIGREALAAVLLLRTTFSLGLESGAGAMELLDRVTRFLAGRALTSPP